jgi:hypothetical protein
MSEHVHEAGHEGIDKVREIIFGAQMRDYEQRFGRLEAALHERMNHLEAAVKAGLEAQEQRRSAAHTELHGHFSAQISYLLEQMRQNHGELTNAIDQRLRELGAAKTDRSSLSALLHEVASRLAEENRHGS